MPKQVRQTSPLLQDEEPFHPPAEGLADLPLYSISRPIPGTTGGETMLGTVRAEDEFEAMAIFADMHTLSDDDHDRLIARPVPVAPARGKRGAKPPAAVEPPPSPDDVTEREDLPLYTITRPKPGGGAEFVGTVRAANGGEALQTAAIRYHLDPGTIIAQGPIDDDAPDPDDMPSAGEDDEADFNDDDDDDFDPIADDDEPVEDAGGGVGSDASDLAHALKLNRLVTERTRIHEDFKARATNAKKLLESAQEQLNSFLKSLEEEYPLFDRRPEPNSQPAPAPARSAEPPGKGWEGVQLRSIPDFPRGPLERLEEAGITSLGQFSELTAKGEGWMREFKGIGEAKAAKIADCLEAFWKDWREKYPERPNGEPGEGD